MRLRRLVLVLTLCGCAASLGMVGGLVAAHGELPLPGDLAGGMSDAPDDRSADAPHQDLQPEAGGMPAPPAAGGRARPFAAAPGGPGAPGAEAAAPEHPRDALRRRLVAAAEVGAAARAGDAAAVAERDRRLASEADPRLRAALAQGEAPDLGRWHPDAPALPEPAAPVPAGEVTAYWLTPGHHEGTYQSAIRIDGEGRATVETIFEPTRGERWHVRYGAWAYRDAAGNTVLDARGQEVELLAKPDWGSWSPDSMVVKPDGLIDLIDDKHDPGQGTTGGRGPG